jgi:hypothetical protein
MAFRSSQLRDDLLPTAAYKAIWQHLDSNVPDKTACKLMVGLLHLAVTEDCEHALGETVLSDINQEKALSLSHFESMFRTRPIHSHSAVTTAPVTLAHYNALIPNNHEVPNVY